MFNVWHLVLACLSSKTSHIAQQSAPSSYELTSSRLIYGTYYVYQASSEAYGCKCIQTLHCLHSPHLPCHSWPSHCKSSKQVDLIITVKFWLHASYDIMKLTSPNERRPVYYESSTLGVSIVPWTLSEKFSRLRQGFHSHVILIATPSSCLSTSLSDQKPDLD